MPTVRGENGAEILVDIVPWPAGQDTPGQHLGLVRVGFHQFTQTVFLTAERLRELARLCDRTAAQLDAAGPEGGDGRGEPRI